LFETCQRNLRTLYGSSVGCSKTYFYKLVSKDPDRIAMIEAIALRSLQDMKP
ncbi:unnamed protein product, partial [Ascophyllum nodosum]